MSSELEKNAENSTEAESEPIVFKPKKRRNLRQVKRNDSDEEEQEDPTETKAKIEEMKDLQKLRQRPNGISLIGLALGKKVTIEEEITTKDAFSIKTGGMVNMQALKTGKMKQVDDAYDTGIGTQFSVETNKRDEDEEMMKYIEEQLAKQKGEKQAQDEAEGNSKKYLTPEEAALMALPAHLRNTSTQKSEEMLSNQMLNGIPEVDLGIEAKIKNIEATEEAKQKMIQDQRKKKDGPSFVPVNMAANFATHSDRYNLDPHNARKRQNQYKKDQEGAPQVKRDPKKATDDFYFDKFRNKFRKH
uniref:CSON006734 protein n=1 Tax=Culicoides sonorensis TaxID=179676 RepID=A0A336LWJ6_CULSO